MTITDTITTQVKSLVDDVKGLPSTFADETFKLRKQAEGFAKSARTQADGVYADLTKKGEDLVSKARGFKAEDIKKSAESLQDKAEDVAEDVQKKAETFVADASKRAEGFVAEARATVTKVTKQAPAAKTAAKPAAKTATAKPAAKKSTAKPAAKKAPAKKA